MKIYTPPSVAHLPDMIDPCSSRCNNMPETRLFLQSLVTPIWWQLDQDMREELLRSPDFTASPLAEAFEIFTSSIRTGSSKEQALLMYGPDALHSDLMKKVL